MRKLLALTSLLLSGIVTAQNISGRILQADTKAPIEDAYVQILDQETGKILASTVTAERGYFSVQSSQTNSLLLLVSHVSYLNYRQNLSKDSLQNIEVLMSPLTQLTDEAVVKSTRASLDQPTTFTNINKKEIERANLGQDMPFLLNMIPGSVVNSDAGAGIGYTGIRIRGVDPTRINVTINGIPVNDAESQGVFWVNMPDFASSVQNIQVQRGVGTSSNGGAAFGATINLQTNAVRKSPYATLSTGMGAIQTNWTSNPAWYLGDKNSGWNFGTFRNNVVFGTGLLPNKWAFEGRLSQIRSDGYIERAESNLKSWYFSGGRYGEKDILKFNIFSGKEVTYQAWNGIPEPKVRGDEEALKPYYALDDSAKLANSGNRTYNAYTYDNEVDNYEQSHYQLHYTRMLSKKLTGNISLHYTRGAGYYEQYKPGEDLADYGLEPVYTPAGDTITSSDIIRRRWLDNHFYGLVYSAVYSEDKLNLIFGGGSNQYQGKHYGEIIWAQFASNSQIRQRYYDNDGLKNDHNIYVKGEYALTKELKVYADLQQRFIYYRFLGFNNLLNNVTQDAQYSFFNPKAGAFFTINDHQQIYLSVSKGSREPTRDDFTQSTPENRPKAEKLLDYEFGYRFENQKQRIQITGYLMDYQDQLILTGKINNVGAYTRVNVPNSYRSGIEAEYSLNLNSNIQWNATAAFSQNKVKEFTEYVDNWDTWTQESQTYTKTDIAFSPSTILSSMFRFKVYKGLELDWVSKYVSKQYLDNTSNNARSLDAFWVNDLRLHFFKEKLGSMKEFRVSLAANNVLNEMYAPNGYTFSGIIDGSRQDFNYLFPQAGTNFLLMLSLGF